MSTFFLYLKLGFRHILDIYAVDHILFIIALSVIFMFKDWKRVLILVTAFTIGHSITLVVAVLELVEYNRKLIEFLIPVTIFLTALSNVFRKKDNFHIHQNIQRNYFLALFFGLIHGLGFANYLKGLLGMEKNIVMPLLAFNIGIELGQVVIVFIFLMITSLFVSIMNFNRRDWVLVLSSAIAGVALTMMFESKYW